MATIGIYYHSNLFETAGGVARVSSWLATRLVDAGHKVFSLVPCGKKGVSDERCVTIEIPWHVSAPSASEVQQIVEDNNIDIIINQCSFFVSSYGLSSVKKAKIVSVVHNNPSPLHQAFEKREVVGNWRGRLWIRLYNALPKLMYLVGRWRTQMTIEKVFSFSNVVCVLSDSYRKSYMKWSKKYGVPIKAIGNPVPWINSSMTKGERTVLWVGRFSHQEKRGDWLLEIWRRAIGQSMEWKLILVGDGPDRKSLEAFAVSNKLNVEFVGRSDSRHYYERASLICLTSPSEGFPLVLPEAMSYGVVPILFDSFGAAHDIVTDGETGFLVMPFDLDAYAKKLKDAMAMNLDIMRDAVRKKAAEFSGEKVFSEWEKLLNETLLH